jgi:hypothetical protein
MLINITGGGNKLQAAVNDANSGDIIQVGDGVYTGGLNFGTKSGITLRAANYAPAARTVDGEPSKVYLEGGVVTGGRAIKLMGFTVRKAPGLLQRAAVVCGPDWEMSDVLVSNNESVGISVTSGCKMLRVCAADNGYLGWGCGTPSDTSPKLQNILLTDCSSVRNNTGRVNPQWAGLGNAVQIGGKWFVNPTWEGGGAKFTMVNNLTIDGGVWNDNVGPGLWLDVYTEDVWIKNLEATRNKGLQATWQGPGVAVEIPRGKANRGVTTIDNIYAHDNTGSDLALWEAPYTVVTRSHFTKNVEFRDLGDRQWNKSEHITVSDNFFYGNAGLSYWEHIDTPELRKARSIVTDPNTYKLPGPPTWKPKDGAPVPTPIPGPEKPPVSNEAKVLKTEIDAAGRKWEILDNGKLRMSDNNRINFVRPESDGVTDGRVIDGIFFQKANSGVWKYQAATDNWQSPPLTDFPAPTPTPPPSIDDPIVKVETTIVNTHASGKQTKWTGQLNSSTA